ncbi:MAG: hypothetical protein H8E44_48210, partial [Planctomycetes bacterium]|nr:hypothetical protein [Planctomycetota bacterium]
MLSTRFRHAVWCVVALSVTSASAADLPDWTTKIRRDHPRLFFNVDTWPQVRERALGAERAWYLSTKERLDRLLPKLGDASTRENSDRGPQAAQAAFVFLVEKDDRYLNLAKMCLDVSIRYYEQCYQERKTVNWYSTSRVHAICAWDWLYDHLGEAERAGLMSRLVQVIDNVLQARPRI